MDFGAHLPLMDFGGNRYTLRSLIDYTARAAQLGFNALSVNDHMVFSVPWLDGPSALAAVLSHSGSMTLATTVSLPAIRGPVPLAKTLAAIDILSEGRLVAAVGPGSSPQDYEAVGLEFSERWARLDESIHVLRARSGAGTLSLSSAASTRPTESDLIRFPHATKGFRSGSEAGARTPACAEPRALEMDGSHRRTTPLRRCSAKRGNNCGGYLPSTARTRSLFRTRSPRCGSTSPKTVTKPIG